MIGKREIKLNRKSQVAKDIRDSKEKLPEAKSALGGLVSQHTGTEDYVNIFQGQIGRYIQDETNHTGLYTDEITTCYILVIYGSTAGKFRFSLIHADPGII